MTLLNTYLLGAVDGANRQQTGRSSGTMLAAWLFEFWATAGTATESVEELKLCCALLRCCTAHKENGVFYTREREMERSQASSDSRVYWRRIQIHRERPDAYARATYCVYTDFSLSHSRSLLPPASAVTCSAIRPLYILLERHSSCIV